jgi:hypothetical protein
VAPAKISFSPADVFDSAGEEWTSVPAGPLARKVDRLGHFDGYLRWELLK